jgi:hypothetical protein
MPTTKMYEGRAVIHDFNDYPYGLENPIAQIEFILKANEACHFFLPPDWYVEGYYEDSRTIVVGLERYKEGLNLQPLWNFRLTADPYEEEQERQWIVFDVVRWQPDTVYSFQIP